MNLEQRTKKHMDICKELNDLYNIKNKKYGNSFTKTYQKYGPSVLCIRLEDKLQRAESILINKETDTDDETIIDTLKDIANYAIMGIMELEKEREI